MNKVYLHIGLHKTASTFLQHHVFPLIPEIEYQDDISKFINYKFIKKENTILISNENISGTPYHQGQTYFQQFKRSLQLIKDIYKNPYLIVSFREPSAFIYSNYKQYLHEGGTIEWQQFFSLDHKNTLLDKEDFFFSKFIDYLADNFEPRQLLIYNFETFKHDNQAVVDDIASFITDQYRKGDIDVSSAKKSNPSVNIRFEKLLIHLNQYDKQLRQKTGHPLKIEFMNKILNQRVFCQYLLPKIFEGRKERDLSMVRNYYAEDWKMAKAKLDYIMSLPHDFIPTVYH